MKTFIAACLHLALCLTLIGCTPIELEKTAAVLPTTTAIVATSTFNVASPTQALVPSPDQLAFPTIVLNTPVVATPAPYTTPDVDQFELPYFQPTEIPSLLQSHLAIQTLPGFNGAIVHRITGWRWGFKSLEWMDAHHLLLYPVAGIFSEGGGQRPGIHPAVISLDSGTFWIPLPKWGGSEIRRSAYYPVLPRWSPQIGALIAATSDNNVAIYSPDGTVQEVHTGNFLGVSPSATKLLIDDTWIDLDDGKTVRFTWQQTEMAVQYATSAHFRPIWSLDEMRVYTCCYVYGDAETGESLVIPYYHIPIEGKEEKNFEALYGTWVLNDKYVLPIWGGGWDGRYSDVYLFDPAAKTYRNLSALAGIQYKWEAADPYCTQPYAQNGGRYVWVDCLDGGHLIDLVTFRSQTYPPPADGPYGGGYYKTRDTKWSADGNFVWFNEEGAESILSGATGKLKPLPKDCHGFEWHPTDNVLLCMSDGDQNLLLLDAQTLSVKKEFSLPAKFGFTWSPDGKYIELVASDRSVWRLDYPRLENFEQLTPPLSQLVGQNGNISFASDPVWSPDRSAVAFISAQDIYVVQIDSKP